MIFFVLFCSLFEDILLTKSGKNNKKEQKRSKKIKKDKNHDLFCSFLRTHFDQIGHKNVDFERVLKKNKKEQKRQRTSWVFPGGMIFFVVGPPPPPPPPRVLNVVEFVIIYLCCVLIQSLISFCYNKLVSIVSSLFPCFKSSRHKCR